MVPALLLFDIDGTLMPSGGAGKHAMVRASRAMFGPRFAWDGVNVAGHLDPLIFAEAAARNPPAMHSIPDRAPSACYLPWGSARSVPWIARW